MPSFEESYKDDSIKVEYIGERSFIPLLIEYYDSKEFQSVLNDFYDKYISLFDDFSCNDSKSESKYDCKDQGDHKLEFTECFHEYQIIIENSLQQFCQKFSLDIFEIFECCKNIADDKFTPLFEEHEHKWFLDIMLSWTDYQAFYETMKDEANKRHRK